MFFGRNEPERIEPDALEQFLGSLFEKKLGQFGAKALGVTKELRQASAEFNNACDELEKLEAVVEIRVPEKLEAVEASAL